MPQNILTAGNATSNFSTTGGDDGTFKIVVGPNGSQVDAVSAAANGATAIKGSTTNDSAAAGMVGEYVVSSITTSTNYPTANQYGDLTSISLTAGDWDVSVGFYHAVNGATISQAMFGVSTTAGNAATGLVAGFSINDVVPTVTHGSGIPPVRFSLAATTTVYLKYLANYSAGTPQARGTIRARRVR